MIRVFFSLTKGHGFESSSENATLKLLRENFVDYWDPTRLYNCHGEDAQVTQKKTMNFILFRNKIPKQ